MNIQNMTAYALNVSSDTKYTMFSADAFAKAAEVVLLGVGMVFAVLALLWLALSVFKLIFSGNTEKKKTAEQSAPEPEAETAPTAVPQTDDGELIAVLTAAIAAYRANEEGLTGESAGGFRVVSFKRAAKGRPWNSNK